MSVEAIPGHVLDDLAQSRGVVVHDDAFHLEGIECRTCGGVFFPPREFCPGCHVGELDRIRFDGTATVEAVTKVHLAPDAFDPPYVAAFVRLAPHGVRVFSPILAEYDGIRIGDDVRLTAGTIGQVHTWAFEARTE